MPEKVNAMYSILFKVFITIVIAFLLDNPEWVGRWEAKQDIAYDSFMSDYYATTDIDCDCTEDLQ